MSATDKVSQQGQEQVKRIADISMQIRNSIRAALPTPAEQFFTVMIPGKVLNFSDYTSGLDPITGAMNGIVQPIGVQVSEAMLVDDMPVLGPVQMGPTGRSVSRSYSNILGKFSPATATVGIEDQAHGTELNADQVRYKKAMTWLTDKDERNPGQTRVDTYRLKQTLYTEACERKIKAFNDALDLALKDPRNSDDKKKKHAYEQWVQENSRTFRNAIQAAYIDFVTLGRKEEVEYWFSIVDNDSAMSRVENSKEAMRNSTVMTSDGSAEFNKVILEPSNWAWLAEQKAKPPPLTETVESLQYKIDRLVRLNGVLEQMSGNTTTFLPTVAAPAAGTRPATAEADKKVLTSSNKLITAEQNLRDANGKDTAGLEKLRVEAVATLNKDREDALTKHAEAADWDTRARMAQASTDAQNLFKQGGGGLTAQIEANKTTLARYRDNLATVMGGTGGTTPAQNLENSLAEATGLPPAMPELPMPTTGPQAAEPKTTAFVPDYWTKISLEVSSASDSKSSETSSSSFAVGASASFGLWSVGGSANHSQSSAKAQAQLANSRVSISFECMRVDITRPWLRPELFFDNELSVGDNMISPGPMMLAALMDPASYALPSNYTAPLTQEAREQSLLQYQMFPLYPTAFLLAANIVLEVSGETSDLQSSLKNSSSNASVSVGYGPFSCNATVSRNKSSQSTKCESTASGCKITISAPQIIGWVSQILPALPRRNEGLALNPKSDQGSKEQKKISAEETNKTTQTTEAKTT